MYILLIFLIIAVLFWGFSIPWIIRTYARTVSGKILYTHQPTTEKRLSRCIAILTWSNKWISIDETPDNQRILRLRDMLDEMQNPHV